MSKTKAPSPFEYIGSISNSIENRIGSEELPSSGIPRFMMIRGIGLYPDTVLIADEANRLVYTSDEMIYNFLHSSIQPKKKRYTKWPKLKPLISEKEISEFMSVNQCGRLDAISQLERGTIE